VKLSHINHGGPFFGSLW